jgi:hypothetical protein
MKTGYCYKTTDGYCKGEFAIYQGKSGGIYLLMGNAPILLSKQQIEQLCLSCYTLNDFNHEEFNKFYNPKTTTP